MATPLHGKRKYQMRDSSSPTKKQKIDDKIDFQGIVKYVSESFTYQSRRSKKDVQTFNAVVANTTKSHKVRVFDDRKRALFESSEMTHKLIRLNNCDVMEEDIIVGYESKIKLYSRTLKDLPDDIEEEANLLISSFEPKKRTQLKFLKTKVNEWVNVKGTVTKVMTISKTKRSLPLKEFEISDGKGSIRVTLWRKQSEVDIKMGQLIELKKAFVKGNEFGISLNVHDITIVKILKQPPQLSEPDSQKVCGQIVGIKDVQTYRSCKRCRRKLNYTVDWYICKSCGGKFPRMCTEKAVVITAIVNFDANTFKDLTIFTEEARKLLPGIKNKSWSDEKIEEKLLKTLPFEVKFQTENDVMIDVQIL